MQSSTLENGYIYMCDGGEAGVLHWIHVVCKG